MTKAQEVIDLMEMPGPATTQWQKLSPKEKANVKAYLERNGNVAFNKSLLRDLLRYGSLTDAQLSKLDPNAFR